MEPAPKSAAVTCALPPGGSSDQAGHDPATVKVQDAVQAPPGLPDTEGDVGHANLVEASKVGEGVAADVQHVVEVLETSPAEQVTVSPVPCGVYLVAGVMALSMLGNEMLYTVLPSIHSQAGVPVEAIGLIFSMNRFTRLLSNTGASWVVDKFGRRWPLIYASCAAIFVTAGYGIIYGVWMFLAFRVMWGIIYSFVRQEAITTAVDLATPSTKGRVMGTYQSIARLGVLVGMLLGGFLTDFMGYRKSFIVFGLITCAAPVLAIVEMSARQQDGAARLPAEMVAAAAEGVEQAELVECDAEQNDEENPPAQDTPKPTPNEQDSGPRGGAVRKYEVVMTFVGAFCFRLVVDGMFTSVLGYMLLERYGENPVLLRAPLISLPVASLNGALLSTLGFVEMVVAPYAGNLGDKLGRHKVLITAFPIAAILLCIMAFETPLAVVIVTVPAVYAVGVTLLVTFNTSSGELAPAQSKATFLSRYLTVNDLGAALGPILAYSLAPRFGVAVVYMLGAGALALMAIFHAFGYAARGSQRV